MLIGILETGLLPDDLSARHGSYPDMFARHLAPRGFGLRTWSVVRGEFPDGPGDADGWLITGSRHGAYDDLPFIPPLEDFIRAAYGAGVPLVGICFGHQIIAQALGGRVEKFAGGWAVGPQEYDFDGIHLRLQAWHQDQVTKAPPDATVIARNAFCAIAGLCYGDRALTVQAHPEFGDGIIGSLIETRGPGVVPDAQLARAREGLGGKLDADALFGRIADFLRASNAARTRGAA